MKKILSYILVTLVFVFLLWNIIKNWHTVSSLAWNLNNSNFPLFLIFTVMIYISNVFSWHIVTKFLGLKVSFLSNTKVWMISNISRFIPGGIWQYPSRVVLLAKKDINKKMATVAVLMEGLLTLSFGAATIFFSFGFWKLPSRYQNLQSMLWVFLLFPFLIFLLGNKKILDKIILIYGRLIGKEKILSGSIEVKMNWLPLIFLSFFCRFFFIGGALYFLIRLVSPLPISLFPVIIGIYALSWLLGYISIFAPAGLGVTEITLATLLSFYIPFSLGIIIAVVFRLAILIAEVLFLFASCIIKEQ